MTMRQGWEKRIGEMRVRSNEDFYLEVETKWGAPSGKGSQVQGD